MSTARFRLLAIMPFALGLAFILLQDRVDRFIGFMFLLIVGTFEIILVGPWVVSTLQSLVRRRASRKECALAFKKLSEWTHSCVIDSENFGYHKQLVAELDAVLFRHLDLFPEDKATETMRWYQAYIERAYEFEIRKW